MGSISYIFFGIMVIPLLVFLFWLIRKDKGKKHLGLLLLLLGILVAAYMIVKFDGGIIQSYE